MSNYTISTEVNGTFVVPSGQIDTSQTSLKLIGRGAAGYGQAIAENTIKQLTNFAGASSPLFPQRGQLWFDSVENGLKIYISAAIGWAEVPVSTHSHFFVTRDELFGAGNNSSTPLMISKGGTGLTTVGSAGKVLTSNGTTMSWEATSSPAFDTTALRTNVNTQPLGDNSITLGSSGARFQNIHSVIFSGTAMQAQYADVAERYAADHPMTPGDLVDIGGTHDITLTTSSWQSAFGVISTAPAFKMNADAGDDITHPYVALIGRVPVKVIGQVTKGDRLTASDRPGVAMSAGKDNHPGVFGRALADKYTEELGFVEVALGAK